jgi:hypothetical protein
MPTWRVRVESAPPNGSPPEQAILARINDDVQDHDLHVVVEYDGHLAVAVTVTASSRRAAFDHGERAIAAALSAAGLADFEIVDVGVLTAAEYERRQRQPRVPRLAGVTEAATILGVSPARAKVIADKYADRIPLVTKFSGQTGAKVWLEESWRQFNATWDRKRTGRPPGSGRQNSESAD